MSTVIKVEDLSKRYRLGAVGTGTISHDLNRFWQKTRGKEDTYSLPVDHDGSPAQNKVDVWALQHINFDVEKGEVLGIIGRNGAGKSTLLKILSRTTAPTKGTVKIKGRVASLLEVGTGFHPELTGRENVFLNGAILGMVKQETRRKFDEIVEFAGVENYIDTPVKRYSSGMYVRLAFGVAAHLEPEILIVDEVLAVGDAEFQKKALGKMKDVSSKEGRTVLFVSHNMIAVENLCTKCILLQQGKTTYRGNVQETLNHYASAGAGTEPEAKGDFNKGSFTVALYDTALNISNAIILGSAFSISFHFSLRASLIKGNIGIGINNRYGQRVITYHTSYQVNHQVQITDNTTIVCNIPELILMPGTYFIEVSIFENNNHPVYNRHNLLQFEAVASDYFGTGKLPAPSYQGMVVGKASWQFNLQQQ